MSKFSNFLGIDVSNEYFDAVIILDSNKSNTIHNQFSNDIKGLKELIQEIQQLVFLNRLLFSSFKF